MNLDEIWNILKSDRESKDIFELPEAILIPNSFHHKEYKITHRFLDSKSAFIGFDNKNTKFHIKIFGVPSFNQVKIIHKNLKLVSDHAEDLKIIQVVDIIEFFDTDRWVVIFITPFIEGFTVDEVSECCISNNFHLPKEISIKIYLHILDAIQVADHKGVIISTLPDNIFLLKNNENPAFPFDLKILPNSLHLLGCGKSKLDKIYPANLKRNIIDGNIWGAGLCLYSFVSEESLLLLPPLIEYNDVERIELLKFFYKDEALMFILQFSLKNVKPQNFMTHPILIFWRELLEGNWDAIEKYSVKQYNAFFSGLTFESLQFRLCAVRKLLILALENSNDVIKALSDNNHIYTFVENCLFFDWNSHPELINAFLMILKEKIRSRTFKEKMISMNFLLIIKLSITLKARQELLFEFIQTFYDDNTLTVLQIAWDEDLMIKLLEKPFKSNTEIAFLYDTMPYFGSHSVDFIKRVYESTEITEKKVIQYIHEIPYYFKQEKSEVIIQIIQKILDRNARIQGDSTLDMLKTIIGILADILCIPKMFQYHHVTGQCTNKSDKLFLSKLGRNRLLIKCKTCQACFCAICKALKHEDHDYQYVLYQNPLALCNTAKPEELFSDLTAFQLPKGPSKIVFIDSNGIVYKNINSHFIGPAGTRITTQDAVVVGSEQVGTVLYFEVKVNCAGLQENIEVGIDGTGIVYRSTDGGVYRAGALVGKGPRFGSYDVVGIGVTWNLKVYITYHGLVSWPMYDCEVRDNLRPLVVLGCDHCDVEIRMRNFIFQPTYEISPNQDFSNLETLTISDKLLASLGKLVKKSFRKNQTDAKAKDLFEKYCELLRAVKKFKLLEGMEISKSRFWPR